MPRYSFCHVDASGHVRERESIELTDDDEARRQALVTSRDLLNAVTSSLATHWRGWTIVVKNESNREICSFPIKKLNSLV